MSLTTLVLFVAVVLGPIQPAYAQMCSVAENQDVINSVRVAGVLEDIPTTDIDVCCSECERTPGCIFAEFRNGNACRLLQGGEVVRTPNNDDRVLVQPVNDNTNVDITVCRQELTSISCPTGSLLRFQNVFFGRDDPDLCDDENVPNPVCNSTLAPGVVRGLCDGRSFCNLEARSSTLGGLDPCDGVSKFLRLRYRCVQETQAPTLRPTTLPPPTTTTFRTNPPTTTTRRQQFTTTTSRQVFPTTQTIPDEQEFQETPAPAVQVVNGTIEGGAQVQPTAPGGEENALVEAREEGASALDVMPVWAWVVVVVLALAACALAAFCGWRIRVLARKKEDARLNLRDPYATTGTERV